jgi:hypothetical protein
MMARLGRRVRFRSLEKYDVEAFGDFAAEPLVDAQGRIVNLFLVLPEADGTFLDAATVRRASSAHG